MKEFYYLILHNFTVEIFYKELSKEERIEYNVIRIPKKFYEFILNLQIKNLDNQIAKSSIPYINKLSKNTTKFYHSSLTKINLSDDFNKEDRLYYDCVYQNPKGIWISCGSDWFEWLKKMGHKSSQFTSRPYLYEIETYKTKIKYISSMNQFNRFIKKYLVPKPSFKKILNWNKIKKDYDGLVICPYLGNKIWNYQKNTSKNLSNFTLHDHLDCHVVDYINKAIGKNVIKYKQFYSEWYRHWETGSGVIWNIKGIKKITLVYTNDKLEVLYNRITSNLTDEKKN